MLFDRHENVQIAGGTTAQTSLALASNPDTCTVLNTSGNIDGKSLLFFNPARTGTGSARVINHPARTVARRTASLNCEKPLLSADLSRPMAAWTRRRRSAALCPATLTSLAGNRRVDPYARLLTGKSVFQCDVQIVSQIGTAGIRLLSPTSTTSEVAKHLVEDVGEPATETEPASAGAGRCGTFEGSMAIAIVGRALFFISQHVIGFVNFLEPLLGNRVIGIAVGMQFHSQFAVSAL